MNPKIPIGENYIMQTTGQKATSKCTGEPNTKPTSWHTNNQNQTNDISAPIRFALIKHNLYFTESWEFPEIY